MVNGLVNITNLSLKLVLHGVRTVSRLKHILNIGMCFNFDQDVVKEWTTSARCCSQSFLKDLSDSERPQTTYIDDQDHSNFPYNYDL